MTILARRAGHALVCGVVVLSIAITPAVALAQSPTPTERLRDAIVAAWTKMIEVRSSSVCLSKNRTAYIEGKWTSVPDGYACEKAKRDAEVLLRDALAALILGDEPPPPPPPEGAAFVTECRYPKDAIAPPSCQVREE